MAGLNEVAMKKRQLAMPAACAIGGVAGRRTSTSMPAIERQRKLPVAPRGRKQKR